jgi:hypothetical protein
MHLRPALLALVVLSTASGQGDKQPDVWAPVKVFVGHWEGTGKGEPGTSRSEREYAFVLNGRFLHVKNRSVYPPQDKNPKGETHLDWGLFSYDRNRKQLVLRQFHVEGFVNQYALKSISSDGKTLVFETESIENIPAGWRARETYRIVNENEFIEVFELAAPGEEFKVYTETHFKRKRQPAL